MDGFLWLIIVGWTIPSAAVSRWLAGEKGYDRVEWTIAGFVFGPLALWAIGMAPRGFLAPFTACPECSEAIYAAATKCPFCQTDLIAESEAEAELDARSNDRHHVERAAATD
jgi:hypothetical protein